MKPLLRSLACALGLLLVGAALPHPQDDLQAAAERWRGLDDSRRRELEQRFEQFRQLDEEQREALRERARALREERAALEQALPSGERERLDALSPHERDSVLRAQQTEMARRRGGRLREKLPPELLDRLREAPPHDRPRMLHHWRRDLRSGEFERRGEHRFGREDADGERLRGLLELPPGEREEGFRRLLREEHDRRPAVLPPAVRADSELLDRLRKATIPTVDELQFRSGRDLADSAQARVIAILRESGRVTDDELQALAELPAPRLLIELHPRQSFRPPSGLDFHPGGGAMRDFRLRERVREGVRQRRAGASKDL